ncbi:MAG: hypothetical protein EA422_07810 [Gemmatimonadales bacterium]|nr:MAG: hypothetical protein EA422_07810 [Gemmatimonadales bacterium]
MDGIAPLRWSSPASALSSDRIFFYFDFVDPGSYLVHEILRGALADTAGPALDVIYRPLELCPPPRPLQDPQSPRWQEMTEALMEVASTVHIPFRTPTLIPWTRKAHELALHAQERTGGDGAGATTLHHRLFRAHFQEGLDLGRVDVLVTLAQEAGLDRSEVHAVLGVDRFAPAVQETRSHALRQGVRGVPTLIGKDRRLEGFSGIEALRSFILTAGPGSTPTAPGMPPDHPGAAPEPFPSSRKSPPAQGE